MRDNSSVDGKKLINSGVPLTLTVVVLLYVLGYSLVKGNAEFSKANADLQATSLCPATCTCTEQKLKLSGGGVEQDLSPNNREEAADNLNVHSKTKPEILKSGIKLQCQNPAFIVSVKKLNLQALLVENIVQYDLSGNSLTRLSGKDFASGSYLMLQKLILKNNQIEEIAADTFSTLKNLKYLDLSNNFLTNFSSAIIEDLKSLDRVKLNGNPLKCDCRLSTLITYVSSRNIRLQGTCSEPTRLKDRSLARLVVEELACPPEDPVGVEIRPNTNQLVFEGDPLKLTCKFKAGRAVVPSWLHRNANNQTATVSPGGAVELSASSRGTEQGTETESQLLIRHLLPRHGGTWSCSWGGRTASVEVTVLSLTTPTCSTQVTASNKGRYSWQRTMANLKIALPCQANPNLQAFRLCGALGNWEEPDLNSCFYLSEVTKVLEQFAKTNLTFSKTSALESARRLKSYLTDVMSLTDPHEAIFVTQTLHNYLEASTKHPELLPIIMDIYSILITQDPQLLADSRHGLVMIIQQAPLKSSEFQYRSSSLVIEKCGIIGKSLSAGTCTWKRTPEIAGSKSDSLKAKNRSRYQASCGQNTTGPGTIEASVRIPLIPEGAFSEQSVILSLVLSTNAFVSAKMKPLATPVLGITSGPVSNLINRTTPFVMTIRLSRAIGASDRLVGARWNHYTDQWSPEQCQTLKSSGMLSEGDSVTFQCCCGFGFFAAFTTQDDENEQNMVEQVTTRSGTSNTAGGAFYPGQLHLLPSPVYVGSVIGLLCHLTACLCYLIHRRQLKMTQPTRHSLINTWISVSLLIIAFTLGVRPVLGKLPCQMAGLLLHYLTLSSLLWMVVNASSLYKHITKSSRSDPETDSSLMEEAMAMGHDSPPKPALRFYLIGWGIPLIVVGIAGAIHLEQYYGSKICFLAWTPSLGAVGLPSAILILLILTFHLLTWCFLRHTSRLAAIHQKQLAAQIATVEPNEMASTTAAESEANKDLGMCGRIPKEKKTCGLQGGYVPLAVDGDVTSCPSNVTNQVTETSDLASLSSDHERIALLIQRGEAEGAMSANGSIALHSGRSESERPLLIVTSSAASSSDDRLEDGAKTDVDEQGHSNPLMASFTDDGDSKKRECAMSVAPSMLETGENAAFHLPVQPSITTPTTEDADEKSTLSQLRGQFVFLVLFCLTWLSGLCIVGRPLRGVLPHYDELVSSLCYAFFSAATGLHAVLFHLLTRKDVCASCFEPHIKDNLESIVTAPAPGTNSHTDLSSHHHHQQHHQQQQHQRHHHNHNPPQVVHPPEPYAAPSRHPEVSEEADRGTERATLGHAHIIDPALAEAMNVTIMDPSMVVNSFYDPRQSKTARRFFQKQKLLQQMQNNQLNRHHHHHHHHRHSRHSSGHSINNAHSYRSHSSHSPITEEALLNASTSTKAKVSNVNIHVEMGAYDWHELQSRLSDNSWGKSGKHMLPQTKMENGASYKPSRTEASLHDEADVNGREEQFESQPTTNSRSTLKTDKTKRKRHVIYHQRIPKKSKFEEQMVVMAEMGTQIEGEATAEPQEAIARQSPSAEKPVYVFVDTEYRERSTAHDGSNDEAMKTLTSTKNNKITDESMDEGAYLKRETSV